MGGSMKMSRSQHETREQVKAIGERVRAAYDRLYDDQIDVDAAFAEFQVRLRASQPGQPGQPGQRGHRRGLPRLVPGVAVAVAVAVAVVAAVTGLVMTGPLGTGPLKLAASHPASPGRLPRPTTSASHSEDGDGTATPGRTSPAVPKDELAAPAPGLPTSLERGQRPVDKTYPLTPGVIRFTAVIPPAGRDGSSRCAWVLTASNGQAKTFRASPSVSRHVNVALAGAQSLRITSVSQDQAPAAGCSIRQMSEHGVTPPAHPSGGTPPATASAPPPPAGSSSAGSSSADSSPAGPSQAGTTPSPAETPAPAPPSS